MINTCILFLFLILYINGLFYVNVQTTNICILTEQAGLPDVQSTPTYVV